MTNQPADPSTWGKIGDLTDTTRGGKAPEPVPGISPVRQPLALRGGEWVCPGCEGVIESGDEGTWMQHGHGCHVVAQMVKAVNG